MIHLGYCSCGLLTATIVYSCPPVHPSVCLCTELKRQGAFWHCPIEVELTGRLFLHVPQYKLSRPIFQLWHKIGCCELNIWVHQIIILITYQAYTDYIKRDLNKNSIKTFGEEISESLGANGCAYFPRNCTKLQSQTTYVAFYT